MRGGLPPSEAMVDRRRDARKCGDLCVGLVDGTLRCTRRKAAEDCTHSKTLARAYNGPLGGLMDGNLVDGNLFEVLEEQKRER
jgi:hypothetical protein